MSKGNAETTAWLVIIHQGQVSLVSLAQFSCQIKAKAGPAFVSCEKRLKNRNPLFLGNAGAEVMNIHIGSLAVGCGPGVEFDPAFAAGLLAVA